MNLRADDPESVARLVESWLGSKPSRVFLKFLTRRKAGKSRLELCLKKYAGMRVKLDFWDELAYKLVSAILNRALEIFQVEKRDLKKALRGTYFRRALVNVLEGIAEFGVSRPQTTAAPFLIVWDFTKRCNLKCKHCYQDSGPEALKDELTTREAKRVIDELAETGVVALAFSGGEPLLRPDFFEIAEYAKRKGFYVSIATNGTLITPKVARRLKRVVDYAEISLDGFEKTHDEFRGIPGVWKRTCEGIRNCVRAGIDTCVAVTVTKWNYRELPAFIDWVGKELKPNRMIFFNFVPTRRGKDIAKQDISPQQREKLLKLLYQKLLDPACPMDIFSTAPQYSRIAMEFAEGPAVATHFTNKAALQALRGRTKALTEFIGGCGAGRLYTALEPNGDIYPCVFIPIKIGNIRQERLKNVWKKSPILKKLRDRESFKGCGSCKYRNICGGCRARAYGYFGDLQGPDPGCIINLKYWRKLK